MNKQEILGTLGQLQELSEEIGRSQKHGQPLPVDTTRKWGQQLQFHIEHIRQELGLVPLSTAGVASMSAGTIKGEHNDLR
ncbi:hypothetical protein D4R49_00595 [bacterium]|nr:MAG: hypothetical protein D4R49_00595 [bacterium]